MLQNIRVDVIYHNIASDFEMEFNLGGCCRMRLLSDKTETKKDFVKSLARAVSRSKIIIVCGPLFSDEGLIKIVASAIGRTVTFADNKAFGIASDDQISIVSGSTPLVTPDGYFGGCIMESGPQTIILITENRAFRKEIMKNLIHPYIEETSIMASRKTRIISGPTADDLLPIEQDAACDAYITEVDNDYSPDEESLPEQYTDDMLPLIESEDEQTEQVDTAEEVLYDEEGHNIDFIMDGVAEDAQQEHPYEPSDAENMYMGTQSDGEEDSHYDEGYVPSQEDSMFLAEKEAPPQIKKNDDKDSDSVNIPIIIFTILLIAAIFSLCYFIIIKPFILGVSTVEYLKEIFGSFSGGNVGL